MLPVVIISQNRINPPNKRRAGLFLPQDGEYPQLSPFLTSSGIGDGFSPPNIKYQKG